MDKRKIVKKSLFVAGVLLLVNGFGNIIDNTKVLTYDVTSILAGAGFILLGIRDLFDKQ